jgi:DNA-binding NarL/FixJ family response regulator
MTTLGFVGLGHMGGNMAVRLLGAGYAVYGETRQRGEVRELEREGLVWRDTPSVSDAAEDVLTLIRGGARGYVTKAISGPDLRAAIRRVHAGDAYFSPYLAGYVLDAFGGNAPPGLDPELDQLTRRERDVLRLVAAGYTYKEVGARLSISPRTVETHAAAVLRKLQLSNRRELSRWATARHLLA